MSSTPKIPATCRICGGNVRVSRTCSDGYVLYCGRCGNCSLEVRDVVDLSLCCVVDPTERRKFYESIRNSDRPIDTITYMQQLSGGEK